jgi:tetratricopeptide (TPR) repeat protein
MESLYGTGLFLLSRGANASIFALKRALRIAPDVGQSWNELGRAYQMLGDKESAYRYLKPYFEEGMVDYYNGPFFANVAIALRKFKSPEKSLLGMLDTYVCQRPMIYFELALFEANRATRQIKARELRPAEASIERGFGYIERIAPGTSQYVNRPILWAHFKAIQAEISLAEGERDAAACLFQEALRLNPDNPHAPKWRSAAADLPPCPDE